MPAGYLAKKPCTTIVRRCFSRPDRARTLRSGLLACTFLMSHTHLCAEVPDPAGIRPSTSGHPAWYAACRQTNHEEEVPP